MTQTLEPELRRVFAETWAAEHGGASAPPLERDTVLLDSGLDSMGFAIFVSNLEEAVGFDPFSLAQDAFYPRTFGEFVDFYDRYNPAK
jgi:acyl carrier protein